MKRKKMGETQKLNNVLLNQFYDGFCIYWWLRNEIAMLFIVYFLQIGFAAFSLRVVWNASARLLRNFSNNVVHYTLKSTEVYYILYHNVKCGMANIQISSHHLSHTHICTWIVRIKTVTLLLDVNWFKAFCYFLNNVLWSHCPKLRLQFFFLSSSSLCFALLKHSLVI